MTVVQKLPSTHDLYCKNWKRGEVLFSSIVPFLLDNIFQSASSYFVPGNVDFFSDQHYQTLLEY